MNREIYLGFRVAGAMQVAAATLGAALFLPTDDIRARIPFLMHGVNSFTLALWLFFILIGFAGLALVRLVSYRALVGCIVMATIVTASVSLGVPSFMPEFSPGQTKVIVFATIALVVVVLLLERRRCGRADQQIAPE